MQYFTDLLDQRPFFMELLTGLVYQDTEPDENEPTVFPNGGSGSGRTKAGTGMSN